MLCVVVVSHAANYTRWCVSPALFDSLSLAWCDDKKNAQTHINYPGVINCDTARSHVRHLVQGARCRSSRRGKYLFKFVACIGPSTSSWKIVICLFRIYDDVTYQYIDCDDDDQSATAQRNRVNMYRTVHTKNARGDYIARARSSRVEASRRLDCGEHKHQYYYSLPVCGDCV